MKYILIFVTIIIPNVVFAQTNSDLDTAAKQIIINTIKLFENENKTQLSKIISYPLKRENPIPDIKNEADFIKRFDEIFDRTLLNKITKSKPEDWSKMGWRGIMLDDGIVWIDYDGKILAVNYQSDVEKKLKAELIRNQKENLHHSINNFKENVYRITTENYYFRIDELASERYRYSSWKLGKSEKEKPDLLLKNGKIEFEGSGGNHTFEFKSGEYKYLIIINIIGTSTSPEANLLVYKNDKLILSEDGTIAK